MMLTINQSAEYGSSYMQKPISIVLLFIFSAEAHFCCRSPFPLFSSIVLLFISRTWATFCRLDYYYGYDNEDNQDDDCGDDNDYHSVCRDYGKFLDDDKAVVVL